MMRSQRIVVGILAGTLGAGVAFAQHKVPNQQPPTAEVPSVAAGDVALGSIRIPTAVVADGKPLSAGNYTVRVTEEAVRPEAVGTTEQLQRWAEFRQGDQVRGREVVSIVPASEIQAVAKDTPPRAGASKVQMLRGNDYVRVWVNRGGTHYLIHLPVPAAQPQ